MVWVCDEKRRIFVGNGVLGIGRIFVGNRVLGIGRIFVGNRVLGIEVQGKNMGGKMKMRFLDYDIPWRRDCRGRKCTTKGNGRQCHRMSTIHKSSDNN